MDYGDPLQMSVPKKNKRNGTHKQSMISIVKKMSFTYSDCARNSTTIWYRKDWSDWGLKYIVSDYWQYILGFPGPRVIWTQLTQTPTQQIYWDPPHNHSTLFKRSLSHNKVNHNVMETFSDARATSEKHVHSIFPRLSVTNTMLFESWFTSTKSLVPANKWLTADPFIML